MAAMSERVQWRRPVHVVTIATVGHVAMPNMCFFVFCCSGQPSWMKGFVCKAPWGWSLLAVMSGVDNIVHFTWIDAVSKDACRQLSVTRTYDSYLVMVNATGVRSANLFVSHNWCSMIKGSNFWRPKQDAHVKYFEVHLYIIIRSYWKNSHYGDKSLLASLGLWNLYQVLVQKKRLDNLIKLPKILSLGWASTVV